MLLPSDVARLVLGYLQEEGLTASTQAFIHESPNLKEYADHTIGDGAIPACVFSVFGKGLTTILNEYVAAKAKESCHEVPTMMTSLWKKLDFTLNQIKSLQNSLPISSSQRTRSRVANVARQRILTLASPADVCSSVSKTSSNAGPAQTSNTMLGHSTPINYANTHARPATGGPFPPIQDVSRLLATPRDSPVQIIVTENRLNPGPMSPGRRKWDRRRGGASSGSIGPGRGAVNSSNPNAEAQPEEAIDENFPQLVIQNARDKILGDRSLQEKLAENINKILSSDPTPQTPKASASSAVETDQSIDEILGLEGEIHMSDDAIHDILEQTESDPAFQALFDLFEYNKTRTVDGEPGDGDISNSPDDGDTPGTSSAVRPLQSDESGTTQRDCNASDTTSTSASASSSATTSTVKIKAGPERKTRKPIAPAMSKKPVLGPSGKASRIENSSAMLLVSHRAVSFPAADSNRKEKARDCETPMDIDGQLNTPPPPSDIVTAPEPAKGNTSIMAAPSSEASVFSSTSASNLNKKQEGQQAQVSKEQPTVGPSTALTVQPSLLPPVHVLVNSATTLTSDLPQMSISSSGHIPTVFTPTLTSESAFSSSSYSSVTVTTVSASPSAVSFVAPFTTMPCSSTSASTLTTKAASSTPAMPISSSLCPLVGAVSNPSTMSPNKAAADSNVVSLKIIISDNQDDNSSSDTALNQAISSISGEKIPTIYLSSPAKSPACPGTPKVNLDEVLSAVSGLQRSETFSSPYSSKTGALVSSPIPGASQGQQNYIIQLPLENTNPALRGATASYFLVTEPPATDAHTRQVLLPAGVSKGQPMPTNQYGVPAPAPALSKGYTTEKRQQTKRLGPALILPSPKPMILPVSVMGQNPLGNVHMVSKQLLAIANPVPVQQQETVKPLPVAIQQFTTAGTGQHLGDKLVQTVAESAGQQDAAKAQSHRRILCFDPSAEAQPQTSQATGISLAPAQSQSTSQSVQQTEKDCTPSVSQTKPTIIGSIKPKRRVHPVRCSADPPIGGGFEKVAEMTVPTQPQQKSPAKQKAGEIDQSIRNQNTQSVSTSSTDASKSEIWKKSESRRSKSTDRKHNDDKDTERARSHNSHSSRSSSSDSSLRSRKEKEGSNRKQREESSGRDKERSSGRDKERSSGRDKERSRGRDKERSSGRDKERSSGWDKERSSGRDKEESSRKEKDKSSKKEREENSKREKEESSRKELAEKAAKSREGRTEKRTPAQEVPNVTANKENEIKDSMQEQQQSTPSSSASRDFSPPAVPQPSSNPQPKATKPPSKTSSLAKQAAEMLHDIQGLKSPPTTGKRSGQGSSELVPSRTLGSDHNQESSEGPRTPSRQKRGKDGEGTPKHLLPPNTPEVPTCSPASEAGSESSINMAAHTLMILSRAAIGRTGTPLKDSLRQEEAGEKSPTSSKNSKKRKQSSPATSPPAKKDREKKKLIDCFPHDLDVDKFLSSLHYDE